MPERLNEINIFDVLSGVPFKIPEEFKLQPFLEGSDQSYEIAGALGLNIVGLGRGSLRFVRELSEGEWQIPIRTPLGPIETKSVRIDNDESIDVNTAPIRVEVELEDFDERYEQSISFTLTVGSERFKGIKDWDFIEEEEDGSLTATFRDLENIQTREEVLFFFPQDPEARAMKDSLEFTLEF